jgi:hypothetical protein
MPTPGTESRSSGTDPTGHPPPPQLYEFRWQKYVPWKGRRCQVLIRGGRNTALVQFEDNGQTAIVSRNALRRA